ncbi:MAG: hypothetical protein A3H93_12600 [Rhodocyclales bacterium RIFCSPLOWO2_02_FULL_63_24]|nr:MAG: hypothetical protein A3H93_12600 [Rhodocyclales bacterium RIFCSPLOWO2_02_FULL_63_24]
MRQNKSKTKAKPNAAAVRKLFERALEHHKAGRLAESKQLYDEILALDPKHADSLHLSGMVAYAGGDLATAASLIEKAIKLEPGGDIYLGNLGNVLSAQGRSDEAVACYKRAIAINPRNPTPYSNLGNAYSSMGKLEDAVLQYEKALSIRPEFYEALFNLGLTLRSLGRFEEAIAVQRKATAAYPDFAEAHYTLGQSLLLHGELEEGWPEYDWRWKLGEYAWLRNIHGEFSQPLWGGESIEGKTILVYGEQGMGDSFQFVRYLPRVVARGAKVIFAVHPPLRRVIGEIPGVTLVSLDTVPLPPFDVHSPLLSLPRILGTLHVEDIPAEVPYLTAEPERVAHWKDRLARFSGFKIGIAWQGNPNAKIDKGRSLPLAAIAPLARLPNVTLISLQQRDGLDQLDRLPAGMRVERLGADVDRDGAFVDTAAIMMNLDLIIVSDSAVAHLAGALGRPVWVPLKKVPDWRFLLERDDSPWYPNMRLFRQVVDGDWDAVFRRIADALSERLHGTTPVSGAALTAVHLRDSASDTPMIPQSWGEIIDKITILEIKTEKLTNPAKLANVRRELNELVSVREQHFPAHVALAELSRKLKAVNESLWWIEDDIRECERAKDFGSNFIELARAVYVTNDQRAAVKREINDLLGSALIEEKSYAAYTDDLGQASAALVENVRKQAPSLQPKPQPEANAAPQSGTASPSATASAFQSGIITSSEQGIFAFDLEDQLVGRSLRDSGAWGAAEVELASRLITTGDNILVVGAHIGTVAVALAKRCAHLTAIEANPANYKFLQCNLILNDVKNVDVRNLAAGDKSGKIPFVFSRHNSGGSKRYPVHTNPKYFHDNPSVTEVDAVALDEFLPPTNYSLILMDIEGSEYFALKGMQRMLQVSRALFVDFIPHHLRNMQAVSPEEFSALLEPHFDILFVPGLQAYVEQANFGAMLRRMYDIGVGQKQIVFLKRELLAAFQAVPR